MIKKTGKDTAKKESGCRALKSLSFTVRKTILRSYGYIYITVR